MHEYEPGDDQVIQVLRQAFEAEEPPEFSPKALLAAAEERDDSDFEAWDALLFEIDSAINEYSFPPMARSGFRSVAKHISKLEPFSLTASLEPSVTVHVARAEKALRLTHQLHSEYQAQLMKKLDAAAYGYDRKVRRAAVLIEKVANSVEQIYCSLYHFLELYFGMAIPDRQQNTIESVQDFDLPIPTAKLETHLDRILRANPRDASILRIEHEEACDWVDEDPVTENEESNAGTFSLNVEPDGAGFEQPQDNHIYSESQR